MGALTNASLVYGGLVTHKDPVALKSMYAWIRALKGLKGHPLRMFRSVRKIRFPDKPYGSEEASWDGQSLSLHIIKGDTIPMLRSMLTHEMGHVLEDARHLIVTEWDDTPYGEAPFVSAYAETNAAEDFAETYWALMKEPRKLKRVAPEKYRDMQSRL